MKSFYTKLSSLCCLFFVMNLFSQETLPIYSDYLSDNVFLIHPAAAGIGNSSKLRFTARQQWAGIPNAPALQTLSFHTKLGEETNAGYGFVLFNDKNGYHSQQGFQGTYAYHLPLSDGRLFEQLSFGLSLTFVQNQSDQRSFFGDPAISQIIESTSYYNSEIRNNLNNGNVLVSAHGNSIRALCKYLFNIDEVKISSLEIPTGNPLLIEIDETQKIKSCKYLDQDRAKDLLVF